MRIQHLGILMVCIAVEASAVGCGGSSGGSGNDSSGGTSSTSSSGGSSSKSSGGTSSKSTGGTSTKGSGGASSKGGAGSCDPTSMMMGGDETACPDLATCVEDKCAADFKKCFGAGYASGNFSGGDCGDYLSCTDKCNCDQTCLTNCETNISAACTSCGLTVGQCEESNCSTEITACEGTGTGGTSGTGGTGSGTGGTVGTGNKTCADLEACCNSLSGDDKTSCQMVYDEIKTVDAECSAIYSAYQLAGQCQ